QNVLVGKQQSLLGFWHRLVHMREVVLRKLTFVLALVLLSGGMAVSQDMRMPINATDVKWGPAPNVFPTGAQIAVVSGDPFKAGPYVVRLKLPADYKMAAHNH